MAFDATPDCIALMVWVLEAGVRLALGDWWDCVDDFGALAERLERSGAFWCLDCFVAGFVARFVVSDDRVVSSDSRALFFNSSFDGF